MIGFLIKKAFFDFWDNMLVVLVMNLGFILVSAASIYLPSLLSFNSVTFLVGVVVAIILFNVFAGCVARTVKELADYQKVTFRQFFGYLKDMLKPSLFMSLAMLVQVVVLLFVFPFYFQTGGLLGWAAISVLFWVSVTFWLSLQYFMPLYTRIEGNIRKTLKKCFLLFFDNTWFSIVLGVGSIVILAASFFTAFLLPGITTIYLWANVAFKLRLRKYDYLEENPGANRRKIPWNTLHHDEKEKVGPRTLKGMFFPWKE